MDLNESGFLKYNNIEILSMDKDKCQVKLTITEHSLNPYAIVHGGLTFALGDTAMGVLCKVMGKNVVTLDSNINYLKPGKGSYLLAIPKLILKIDDAVFSKVVFSFFSIAAVRDGNSVEEKLTPITNPNCIKG